MITIDGELEDIEEIALSSDNDSDCEIADIVINENVEVVYEKHVFKNTNHRGFGPEFASNERNSVFVLFVIHLL